MKELSLHIMDLAENGIAAKANCITIVVDEAVLANYISISIGDNGSGVTDEMLKSMLDPFVTSRTTRRVGMGLSLYKAAAERCDGEFKVESELGKGTTVSATFRYDHIDRVPLGDMATSIMSLLAGYPEIDIDYTHMYDDKKFIFDTCGIREELGEVPLNEPAVLQHLKNAIKEELNDIRNS
jgi:hypothetical protein